MPSKGAASKPEAGNGTRRGLKAAFCFGVCTSTLLHTWRSEDNVQESVLFFHYMGFGEPNSGHQACWQVHLSTEHLAGPFCVSEIRCCYVVQAGLELADR